MTSGRQLNDPECLDAIDRPTLAVAIAADDTRERAIAVLSAAFAMRAGATLAGLTPGVDGPVAAQVAALVADRAACRLRSGEWLAVPTLLVGVGDPETADDVVAPDGADSELVRRCRVLAELGRLRRQNRALTLSEEAFRSVAQSATDALVTADERGHIVFWNRAAARLFGHSEAQAVGAPLTLIIPPRHRPAHDVGMARVHGGGPHRVIGRTVELEAIRQDGSEFPVELSLASWMAGGARFYSGIIRDISDRRAAEDRLRGLATRLAESERAAQIARDEAVRLEGIARDASRAKTAFLANMSHELRTPLNVIIGFAQLLERDRSLGADELDGLSTIARAGEHLLALINEVLALSKIEAGAVDVRDQPFDLARLLSDLHSMFRRRAEAKRLRLAVTIDPAVPPFVRGDEGKLRQILLNLLANAVRLTDDGGVELTVATGADTLRFAVTDSGPGMTADEAARLFRPFVQAERGRQSGEGTGLGLAISHRYAALLGGTLDVTTRPGAGSTFTLVLPLRVADGVPTASVERPIVGLAPGAPATRILIADDDEGSRKLLVRLLGSVGLEVREAADGLAAVATWEVWRPHLVWMDMRMPGLDGYQATRRIRARQAELGLPRAGTRIAALTASPFARDEGEILAAGCDAYVLKPVGQAKIFAEIERLLEVRFVRAPASAPVPVVAGSPFCEATQTE